MAPVYGVVNYLRPDVKSTARSNSIVPVDTNISVIGCLLSPLYPRYRFCCCRAFSDIAVNMKKSWNSTQSNNGCNIGRR